MLRSRVPVAMKSGASMSKRSGSSCLSSIASRPRRGRVMSPHSTRRKGCSAPSAGMGSVLPTLKSWRTWRNATKPLPARWETMSPECPRAELCVCSSSAATKDRQRPTKPYAAGLPDTMIRSRSLSYTRAWIRTGTYMQARSSGICRRTKRSSSCVTYARFSASTYGKNAANTTSPGASAGVPAVAEPSKLCSKLHTPGVSNGPAYPPSRSNSHLHHSFTKGTSDPFWLEAPLPMKRRVLRLRFATPRTNGDDCPGSPEASSISGGIR